MPIATNPTTGETLFLDPSSGQWSPAKVANNPQTGESVAFDGTAWVPLKIQPAIPSGAPGEVTVEVNPLIDGTPHPATEGQSDGLASTIDKIIAGGSEAALALGTGAAATVLSGIAGVGKTGSEALLGDLDLFGDKAVSPESREGAKRVADTISQVQKAATFQPRTPEGKQTINAIGEFFEPVGKFLQEKGRSFADKVLSLTGSPILASIAEASPEIGVEILGAGIGGRATLTAVKSGKKAIIKRREGSQITRDINEAVPQKAELFRAASQIYKELDESGVTINQRALPELAKRVRTEAKKFGLDTANTAIAKIGQQNLPKAAALVKGFNEVSSAGRPILLTELDQLRKAAQTVAGDIDPTTKAIGSRVIDTIDDFLETAGDKALNKPKGLRLNISRKYRVARNLWGRARKSELVQDAIEGARQQASGFENGIRIALRKIIKDDKKKKRFAKDEIEAMQRVVNGTPGANLARLVGKLGFTDGKSSNIIGGSIGAGAGLATGIPGGVVIIPTIGIVSKVLAKKMTKGNAGFADQVIRAGKDARRITKAYRDRTPKGKRSKQELSELLMRGDIDLSRLPESNVKNTVTAIVETARQKAGIQSPPPSPSPQGPILPPTRQQQTRKEVKVRRVDPLKDSFLQAVAINGGLNASEVKQLFGLDRKDFSKNKLVVGKPILKNSGGRDIDDMAQALAEDGYISKDANGKADVIEFEERFFEEEAGNKQFSSFRDPLEDVDLDAEFEKFLKDDD